MPYVNPNKMRNVSAAGSDIRAQKIPKKPKIAPTRGLQAPGQDKMDQISAVQDPAERYKASLNTLAQQMGNNKGNTGLRFNTGQQEWLQSLNPADQMKELLAAFSRQRPHFGQQPMHNAGVPSPVGPQPMIPNEGGQVPPSGQPFDPRSIHATTPYQSDQPGMYHGAPYSQIQPMPMPQVSLQQLLSGGGGIGMIGGPSASPAGVPSPLGGGMHSMNGGGYQAPPQMQNPYGMQGMNGGGYQAPPSNQNPFMLSLMRMLGRG